MPFWALYFLSDCLYLIVHRIIGYRKKVIKYNLQRAFPYKQNDELLHIEERFYRQFCDIAVESIKSLNMNGKSILKRFDVQNVELVEKYYRAHRNVVLYAAHFGNWEWLAFMPYKLSHQCATLYQRLSNRYMNNLMKMIRSNNGVICIDVKSDFRSFLDLDNNPKPNIAFIIGDQSPPYVTNQVVWCEFLGIQTAFFSFPAKAMRNQNKAIIYPRINKPKRGTYQLTFELITDNPRELTVEEIVTTYAKKLEENINDVPELWLWSHNRWKLSMNISSQAIERTSLRSRRRRLMQE